MSFPSRDLLPDDDAPPPPPPPPVNNLRPPRPWYRGLEEKKQDDNSNEEESLSSSDEEETRNNNQNNQHKQPVTFDHYISSPSIISYKTHPSQPHQKQQQQSNHKRSRSLLEAVVDIIPSPLRRHSFFHHPTEEENEQTPLLQQQQQQQNTTTDYGYDNTSHPSPLLDPNDFPEDDDDAPTTPVVVNHKVQHAWNVLRNKVQSGDLLLNRRLSNQPLPPPPVQSSAAASKSAATLAHQLSTCHSTDSERHWKRQQAQESIRNNIEITLTHCLVIFGAFMALSCAAFCFVFDKWSLIDAMYFALVTCSTVGYGDLVPDSAAGRIFTCLYALAGVCFLGIALGVLGNQIVESQEAAVEQTSTVAKKRLLSLFSSPDVRQPQPATPLRQSEEEGEGEEGPEQSMQSQRAAEEAALFVEEEPHKMSSLYRLSFHFLVVMILLALFALTVSTDPGVDASANGRGDFADAFYFAIVTATTVGYGDYSPVTQQGRLMAIFFIPIAVGAMGHFLSSVAETIMDLRAESVRVQMASRELSPEDLEIMDADGDGLVTRAEFLEFMLVAMNKVDKEFIDELRDHFSRLDVDGTGVLSKDDLIYQARQKLRRINRKLQLSAYKQQLLRQAAEGRHLQRRSGQHWGVREPLKHLKDAILAPMSEQFASTAPTAANEHEYDDTSSTCPSHRSSSENSLTCSSPLRGEEL